MMIVDVMTVNAGSSSVKFALFGVAGGLRRRLHGAIEGIGRSQAEFSLTADDPSAGEEPFRRTADVKDHSAAGRLLMDWVSGRKAEPPRAFGHRVVHGGPRFHAPCVATEAVLGELRQLSAFDPEHLPAEIALIEGFAKRFANSPQVACFDTSFHHDLPLVARRLAIPLRYEAQGVRRYGFHGLSYQYLVEELDRIGVPGESAGRLILAHLGGGASLAAVANGRPVDTSMAFTPAAGLPMSTRLGDMDPGLVGYLARREGMDAGRFTHFANYECGLLGLSETSGDMRELAAREGQDVRAAAAIDFFCYQVRKWIGSFAAALGGVDTLVFAGGIGEHMPSVRERSCAGLQFLGIALDPAANAASEPLISASGLAVRVRVIRTDEEQVIAAAVCRLLTLS